MLRLSELRLGVSASGQGATGGAALRPSLTLDFLNQGYESFDYFDVIVGVPQTLALNFTQDRYEAYAP
jgi:hypothetical protein